MKSKTKILMSVLFAFTLLCSISTTSLAQEDSSDSHSCNHHKMGMNHDHHEQMDMDSTENNMDIDENQNMDMEKHQNKDLNMNQEENDMSIVREGVIDLEAIDVNKDGKVFQDHMDWNVISDEPGKCPLCGMNLKEVSLEKTKENLIKHNFKVKE